MMEKFVFLASRPYSVDKDGSHFEGRSFYLKQVAGDHADNWYGDPVFKFSVGPKAGDDLQRQIATASQMYGDLSRIEFSIRWNRFGKPEEFIFSDADLDF